MRREHSFVASPFECQLLALVSQAKYRSTGNDHENNEQTKPNKLAYRVTCNYRAWHANVLNIKIDGISLVARNRHLLRSPTSLAISLPLSIAHTLWSLVGVVCALLFHFAGDYRRTSSHRSFRIHFTECPPPNNINKFKDKTIYFRFMCLRITILYARCACTCTCPIDFQQNSDAELLSSFNAVS